jgi:hypothetical protein
VILFLRPFLRRFFLGRQPLKIFKSEKIMTNGRFLNRIFKCRNTLLLNFKGDMSLRMILDFCFFSIHLTFLKNLKIIFFCKKKSLFLDTFTFNLPAEATKSILLVIIFFKVQKRLFCLILKNIVYLSLLLLNNEAILDKEL